MIGSSPNTISVAAAIEDEGGWPSRLKRSIRLADWCDVMQCANDLSIVATSAPTICSPTLDICIYSTCVFKGISSHFRIAGRKWLCRNCFFPPFQAPASQLVIVFRLTGTKNPNKSSPNGETNHGPHGRKLIQSHEKTKKNQGRNALVPCSWKEIINHFLGCHGTCQVVCRTIMYYNSRISSKLTVQHPVEVLTGFNGMDQDLECWERFAGKNARNRLPAEYVDTIDTTGGLYLGVVLYPLYTNMFCLHYVVVLLTAVVENTFCLNLDFKRPRFLLGEKCIYTNIYTYIKGHFRDTAQYGAGQEEFVFTPVSPPWPSWRDFSMLQQKKGWAPKWESIRSGI